MNQGYQQGYPQTAPVHTPMPAPAPPGGAAGMMKKNPLLLVAGGLLGVFVFCNWLVGAFKIDGDAGRFLSHTGTAMGTAGLGILMLAAFHRITEKDKDHPTGVGLGLVICMLLLAVVGLGTLLHIR